jgi:hypothetical protein
MFKLIVHVTQIDKIPELGIVSLVLLLPEEDLLQQTCQ